MSAPGFDTVTEYEHTVGFGHDAVLGVADKVVAAVKAGEIKHFAVIGGCDGSEGERSYYTDVAQGMPNDWMILTLGCGKYRVIGHDYGTVAGLPRLLDMGQCNDSFSAVKVALALADAFECGLNDLPLSLVLSWFEQKAVCVLLALLHLGVGTHPHRAEAAGLHHPVGAECPGRGLRAEAGRRPGRGHRGHEPRRLIGAL